METYVESNRQETCTIIRDFKRLNSEGCRFFIDANSFEETLISSTLLRWLSHRDDEDEYYTKEQEKAIKKIKSICKYKNKTASEIRIKILLYDNPRKKEERGNKHIKMLLNCGGIEIKYLHVSEDKKLRIAIQGRKLYLSLSENQEQKVHEGFLYQAGSDNNPLLNYFKSEFYRDFNRAKTLQLKNGRIVFADNWFVRTKEWLSLERTIAIIGVILTFVFGFLALK